MYQLIPGVPDIELMDGPDRGKRFVAGEKYAEVPETLRHLFARDSSERSDESKPSERGGKKK